MKVTRKYGLSHYTLELNDVETSKWKEVAKLDIRRSAKSRKYHEIFEEAFIRIKFGGVDNAIKAVKSLEPTISKLESIIKRH